MYNPNIAIAWKYTEKVSFLKFFLKKTTNIVVFAKTPRTYTVMDIILRTRITFQAIELEARFFTH
mgnify:CR=1 FL=1